MRFHPGGHAMPETTIDIHLLDAPSAEPLIPALIGLLQDAVSTASLGFWHPLERVDAEAYWRGVLAEVTDGHRWLWVALRDGEVIGSLQLAPAVKENAPHRAEVQKLMALSSTRRQGIGRRLMEEMERLAREQRRTLLVLDTNTGSDAETFYDAIGYTRVGVIPRYTVERDGSEHATTLFYKWLGDERGATR